MLCTNNLGLLLGDPRVLAEPRLGSAPRLCCALLRGWSWLTVQKLSSNPLLQGEPGLLLL